MRIDVMTDIETFGKGDTPPVFQIAAIAFDIKTGKTIDTFNMLCDIRGINNIEGDTLSWWLNTSKELLSQHIQEGVESNISEEKLVHTFIEWISTLPLNNNSSREELFLWGNGILFDNRIVKNKCSQYNLAYPIFYRNDRDMRTIVELAAIKQGFTSEKEFRDSVPLKNRVEHDALNDVRHQIKVLCKAYNLLR